MEADDLTKTSQAFYDLVIGNNNRPIKEWPKGSEDIVLRMAQAAAFDAATAVRGDLRGRYVDQGGSPTGDTYSANPNCQFKIVAISGGENWVATGWLNDLVRNHFYSWGNAKDRDVVVARIIQEVERNRPLVPIQVTADGDFLCEYPPEQPRRGLNDEYLVDHVRDKDKFERGIHKYCGGEIVRRGAIETYDVLVCKACHLRVRFSKSIGTFGELRSMFNGIFGPVQPT